MREITIAIFNHQAQTEEWHLRGLHDKVVRSYLSSPEGWSWKQDWVYRDGQLVGSTTPAKWREYHLDHLGSPRLVTGPIGLKVAEYHPFPFGEMASESGPGVDESENLFRYTGHERDVNCEDGSCDPEGQDDLDYMLARLYSPVVGRFLGVDPDSQSADTKKPQSWSKYAYVLSNPLAYIDPLGERWFSLGSYWVFLRDVDYIRDTETLEDGTTIEKRVEGLESLVTFDGSTLSLLQPDGNILRFNAVSGTLDSQGRTQSALQGERNVGPVPEGAYSFSPEDIQQISFLDNLIGTLSLGNFGAWPGGTIAWGRQRVFLKAAPETPARGRTGGYAIHGGARPGSRGCIDLCDAAPDFFNAIDRTVNEIPVYVDYPND